MERCKHKVDKLIGKNMFSGSLEPFGMLQPIMKAYSFSPPYYSNKIFFHKFLLAHLVSNAQAEQRRTR
uniref:Uncharacterized protein n=1 Tax=Solanum lycopersicum TaxID=4081 RepID=A0A3Q7G717_SOLLC